MTPALLLALLHGGFGGVVSGNPQAEAYEFVGHELLTDEVTGIVV